MAQVLVACEYSGRVRDALLAAGVDAVSCDVLPTATPGPHLQGDVRDYLGRGYAAIIAFPPCTYLSAAASWRWGNPLYQALMQDALSFVQLLDACAPVVAIENPKGALSKLWRPPDQYVQPYMFGDPETKRTGLWLKQLPPLLPTHYAATAQALESRVGRRGFHANQTAQRRAYRSLTPEGLATAMAQQWGSILKGL